MEIFTDPYMLEKLDRDLNEINADSNQRWYGGITGYDLLEVDKRPKVP
jgi:hypothetical protein